MKACGSPLAAPVHRRRHPVLLHHPPDAPHMAPGQRAGAEPISGHTVKLSKKSPLRSGHEPQP
jgi:hypothetical protein